MEIKAFRWMTEKDIRIILYGASGFLTALFFILVCYGTGGSLVQNLFTTAAGATFTVFVVDRLTALAEKRRTEPGRFAAYVDARGLYDRCRFLWVQMLVAVLDKPPNHDADPFCQEYCQEVCAHLDLNRPAPILPARTWREHVFISSTELREAAGRYFIRYVGIGDMMSLELINRLERSGFLDYGTLLQTLPAVDHQIGVRRFPVLGSEFANTAFDFLSILHELRSHLEEIGREFDTRPGFFPVPPATYTEDLRQFTPPKLGFSAFQAKRMRRASPVEGQKSPRDGRSFLGCSRQNCRDISQ
jgi:hypothetical protein